jgi:hypothetical protein
MKSLKLIALTALALVVPASASAQDGPRAMGRARPMLNTVEWLLKSKDEFKATADQAAKIQEIGTRFDAETAKQREEFRKIREEMLGGGDRQTVMQKMQPIRDELQKKDEAALAEVMKLLDEDQRITVKQLLESRRQDMRNRTRKGNPGTRTIQ